MSHRPYIWTVIWLMGPDGTKPFLTPVLVYDQWGPVALNSKLIQNKFRDWYLEIFLQYYPQMNAILTLQKEMFIYWLRWSLLTFPISNMSTLVLVMAWCCEANIHYFNQCWPRLMTPYDLMRPQWINSSPPGQNGHHFTDNIFRCIFGNEKFCILIKVSLKFAPKGSIDNNAALI